MKKLLIIVISLAYVTSCAKSRQSDDNAAENPSVHVSDLTVASAQASLSQSNSSGHSYVHFSAMNLATIDVCRSLGYSFQVAENQKWYKQESPGRFPYVSDQVFRPGNPGDLGCDYMRTVNLNGFTEKVSNQELILIRTEKLGEERLKLVPHAADLNLTQDTEISIYETRVVKVIRFEFDYYQESNKFQFIKEFSLN